MVDTKTASNPFFRTENGGYGTSWASHESGQNPVKAENTPIYRETVSKSYIINFNVVLNNNLINNFICQGERELALKNSKRTYKHEILKEMRENGELDT